MKAAMDSEVTLVEANSSSQLEKKDSGGKYKSLSTCVHYNPG